MQNFFRYRDETHVVTIDERDEAQETKRKTTKEIDVQLHCKNLPQLNEDDEDAVKEFLQRIEDQLRLNVFPLHISHLRAELSSEATKAEFDTFVKKHKTNMKCVYYPVNVVRFVHNELEKAGFCVSFTRCNSSSWGEAATSWKHVGKMVINKPLFPTDCFTYGISSNDTSFYYA